MKTVYEKQFIVVEAKQSLSRAVENLACPELCDILVDGCQAKNLTLAEYAIGYLLEAVKKMPVEYLREATGLVAQMVTEYEGKRMKIKKSAEAIFHELKAKLGLEGVEKVIMEAVSDKEGARDKTNAIMKLFEDKGGKKTDKSHDFRSFLK